MQKGDLVTLANTTLNKIDPSLEKYNPVGMVGTVVEIYTKREMEVVSKTFKSTFGINDDTELEKAKWIRTALKNDCVVQWQNGHRNSYKFRDLNVLIGDIK